METLPWSWYADPELLRREGERIFRRHWQYVGHTRAPAEPNASLAAAVGEIPVAVHRGRDGELRASLDVRGRRGLALAERSRPGPAPMAVDTWGPFVFVSPDPDAPPLAEALGPLPGLVAEALDVEALRFHVRAEWEVAANWKVTCENFLECYHCPVAHPGFSALVDVSPDAYVLADDGLTSTQLGPLRKTIDGEVQRSQFHFLWPATGINIFPGRPNLSIGAMLPAGPERTRRFLDYFFAEDAGEEWIAELMELDGQVGAEDTVLVEGVQRGMRSGILGHGRLLPESERLVAHFQRLTRDALAGSLPTSGAVTV